MLPVKAGSLHTPIPARVLPTVEEPATWSFPPAIALSIERRSCKRDFAFDWAYKDPPGATSIIQLVLRWRIGPVKFALDYQV